jgi:hypothetical protein
MSYQVGRFCNQQYDDCAYDIQLNHSTSPYFHIMNTDRIYNCNGCLPSFGPVSSHMGVSASTPVGNAIAASQRCVDIDSVLSNRNVKISKCKEANVNPINVTKIKTKNLPICKNIIDGEHTKLSDPAMFYRGIAINRFHDLQRNPQEHIYYDWAINTDLEMKDNFDPDMPDISNMFN